MNKLYKLALVGLAALVGAIGPAIAADTSSTVTVRRVVQPVGSNPAVAYVHITATASSVPNGFTFDLPIPAGKTTNDIIGFIPQAATVSGSLKTLTVIRSGKTVTVSGSNMTSGTVAVGDVVRGIVIYKP